MSINTYWYSGFSSSNSSLHRSLLNFLEIGISLFSSFFFLRRNNYIWIKFIRKITWELFLLCRFLYIEKKKMQKKIRKWKKYFYRSITFLFISESSSLREISKGRCSASCISFNPFLSLFLIWLKRLSKNFIRTQKSQPRLIL